MRKRAAIKAHQRLTLPSPPTFARPHSPLALLSSLSQMDLFGTRDPMDDDMSPRSWPGWFSRRTVGAWEEVLGTIGQGVDQGVGLDLFVEVKQLCDCPALQLLPLFGEMRMLGRVTRRGLFLMRGLQSFLFSLTGSARVWLLISTVDMDWAPASCRRSVKGVRLKNPTHVQMMRFSIESSTEGHTAHLFTSLWECDGPIDETITTTVSDEHSTLSPLYSLVDT